MSINKHRLHGIADLCWQTGKGVLGKLGRGILDLLFPPNCPLCHDDTLQVHSLCNACWSRIEHLNAPFCDICCEPYPISNSGYGGPLVCGDCIASPPAYGKLRAALIYNDEAKKLILAFKHFGQDGLVKLFHPWLQRVADPMLDEVDVIVAVPIHWTRLWKRGFNQSAIMANQLDLTNRPVNLLIDGLLRIRRTPPQGRSGKEARTQNLKGAIKVNPSHMQAISGKRVLVVDDVATSGATLNACAKALRQAGASDVTCLVLAKPLRDPMSDTQL